MAAPALARFVDPIALLVIDESRADLRWFELMIQELGTPCELRTYPRLDTMIAEIDPEFALRCSAIFLGAVFPLCALSEAVQSLRAIPQFASTPIICLVDGKYEVELAKRAGATRWLPKPVQRETLAATLDRLTAARLP